jgi:hypothetical protein
MSAREEVAQSNEFAVRRVFHCCQRVEVGVKKVVIKKVI